MEKSDAPGKQKRKRRQGKGVRKVEKWQCDPALWNTLGFLAPSAHVPGVGVVLFGSHGKGWVLGVAQQRPVWVVGWIQREIANTIDKRAERCWEGSGGTGPGWANLILWGVGPGDSDSHTLPYKTGCLYPVGPNWGASRVAQW